MLWISNSQNFSSLFENYTIQGHTLRIDVGQNRVRKHSLKQKSAVLLWTLTVKCGGLCVYAQHIVTIASLSLAARGGDMVDERECSGGQAFSSTASPFPPAGWVSLLQLQCISINYTAFPRLGTFWEVMVENQWSSTRFRRMLGNWKCPAAGA